jgi:plasmid stabilization system protein ParE
MAERALYNIVYSERSLSNIEEIRDHLLYKFTQKEVDNLYHMLGVFESLVKTFPQLYPLITNSKNIRRAVLSKQLSVFYACSKNTISIAAVLDNRMDDNKWPK